MKHVLTQLEDGSTTLTETLHGQAMHSKLGVWKEALQVYVANSGIESRQTPLVLWDVGMGTAANAVAALEHSKCPLEIWSFESDLDGIRTARANVEHFPFLQRHSELLNELISKKQATLPDNRGTWNLIEGDFRKELARANPPDLIFWDFYSPSVVPELWSLEVFQNLTKDIPQHTLWISYAAATPIRAALVLAGFFVGKGPATQAKSEITLASPSPEKIPSLLGKDWLGKIERSARPFPYGYTGTRPQLLSELRDSKHFRYTDL
jgi:queuine tRNA-ribosyltransferase